MNAYFCKQFHIHPYLPEGGRLLVLEGGLPEGGLPEGGRLLVLEGGERQLVGGGSGGFHQVPDDVR